MSRTVPATVTLRLAWVDVCVAAFKHFLGLFSAVAPDTLLGRGVLINARHTFVAVLFYLNSQNSILEQERMLRVAHFHHVAYHAVKTATYELVSTTHAALIFANP